MRGHDFLDKMKLTDTSFVTEANTYPKKQSNKIWIKWVSVAACLCFIFGIGTKLAFTTLSPKPDFLPYPTNPSVPISDPAQLSMITITQNTMGDMGYEGYLAHDISELVNENPWNESMELSTLPVYKNPLAYNDYYNTTLEVDIDRMQQLLLSVAGRMGLNTKAHSIITESPKNAITDKHISGEVTPSFDSLNEPTSLIIEEKGIKIQVDATMTVQIDLNPAISLPKELSFTHGTSSYEDMKALSTYLQKEYSDLLGMKNPTANIFGGDYNISGQQHYSIAFFDNTGTDTEKLINYNLNPVHFSCNDDGKLFLIRVCRPDLGNALGNYPIITAKEAKELLLQGNYITSVPYQMPGNKYISKVELVYRNANWDAIYMPYYKFYVELPQEQRGDLKTYGAYYVPAVKSQYISKMPIWNGDIN